MKALYFLPLLLFWGCAGEPGAGTDAGVSDWPFFRGDAGLRGYSAVELPEKPVLRWTYPSEARTASSPVVYRQTAYWCDKRGQTYGVDIDGNRCFAYNFATAVEATPMIYDSVLYIGRIDGYMSALSLEKQDTLWNFETMGQISASPNIVLFEGRPAVVFGSYDNYLYCIDKENGREICRFESGYYINGAVALMEHYFLSGGCDAWLRIIDGSNGQPSDSLLLDTYIPASPAIDGEYGYIADHSGNVYELVVRDGKILRSGKIVTATNDSGSFVSVPALSSTTLFLLSDDRYLYAIDRSSGAVRWKYLQKGPSGESSPVVCRNKVISCTRSGIVSVLDAKNGELLWEYDTGESITACPAVIKGYFYILTAKGTLFCFGDTPSI
ncbi:MAG: PQQ-binding-like beta-propeller repeat protein [Tannerellaceae bacterium]|jgi:outer membrane protein assembly factor BamB|nr:PQQ-binding-like beta-propeller repeat protein [Tannerellaceae bacterium]